MSQIPNYAKLQEQAEQEIEFFIKHNPWEKFQKYIPVTMVEDMVTAKAIETKYKEKGWKVSVRLQTEVGGDLTTIFGIYFKL